MRVAQLAGAVLGAMLAWAAPALALDTVVTGLIGSPSSGSWPYHIGIKKGFFADNGIKLDLVYVPTAPGLVQELSAGSLDIAGTVGVVEPIHAIEKGAPVALFRIVGAISPYTMLAKPTIHSIKELKGKTICIGGLADINRVYLERMVQANGLKDGQFDIVVAGSTGARFAALKSGAVDATMLVPPYSFYAEAAGYNNIGMIADYAGDLPFSGASVSLPWAAKHRDTLTRFRAALDRSIAWFYQDANRDEAIDILTALVHTKRADVAQSYDFLRKIHYYATDDTLPRKGLQHLIDAMKALGDIEGKITPDRLVIAGFTKITD